MTLEQCSMDSINLNGGGSISEENARAGKEAGYGWLMWYAFDPSGTGDIENNYESAFQALSNAAKGLYDMELMPATGVYNKIGEGQYDPQRYPME